MPERGTPFAPGGRRYFPICVKILCWLLANFALVGLAVAAVSLFQFHFGPESLLEGRVGERLERTGAIIASELQHTPQSEWNSLLSCFSEYDNLQAVLLHADGKILAGGPFPIPPAVRDRMLGLSRCCGPATEDASGQEEQGCTHRFLLRAGNPERTWVGVRIPPAHPFKIGTEPVFLLFCCESLLRSGFLFDWTPWVGSVLAVAGCSILFWTPLVRGIARSIHQMTNAAAQIALGRFKVRVEEERSDDLGRLGASINHMASRLDTLVSGQKRFLGDIAHELCSPLARMELALGVLEQRGDASNSSYLQDVREEVRHMSNLLNELLSFTKSEIGPKPRLQTVFVADAVAGAVQIENPPPNTLQIEVPSGLSVRADPALIERALCNLVRNALRYATHAGPIRITAAPVGTTVEIRVSDSGPGVAEDCLPHIFEPFYRPETHRDRASGGTGLGLAIVRSCIQNCGGTARARNLSPSGLEVTLALPSGS
jgi:two-component system sensor histidine kinase CpxA